MKSHLDRTISFLNNPYMFIADNARHEGNSVFETRLMLNKTICMTGSDAAKIFYDPERFVRKGGAPEPLKATLFGKGGIQGQDGEAHLNRKKLFMSFATDENINQLMTLTHKWLRLYAQLWEKQDRIVLYDELQEVMTRVACEWAGVPVTKEEFHTRVHELTSLFDDAGSKGLGHLKARLMRKGAEAWIEDLVKKVRIGKQFVRKGCILEAFSWHRDEAGDLLPPRLAAVEIINILRPMVAISLFMVFEAHALAMNPRVRDRILNDGEKYADLFVQEVRRYYPFFPSIAARVKEDFEWKGLKFRKGTRALLDIFGTNNDPHVWSHPRLFLPERFLNKNIDAFTMIPQGGGDFLAGHRCPGEWFTMGIMKVAALFFVNEISFDLPEQDLTLDLKRIPAIPRSRFVMTNVRVLEESEGEVPVSYSLPESIFTTPTHELRS